MTDPLDYVRRVQWAELCRIEHARVEQQRSLFTEQLTALSRAGGGELTRFRELERLLELGVAELRQIAEIADGERLRLLATYMDDVAGRVRMEGSVDDPLLFLQSLENVVTRVARTTTNAETHAQIKAMKVCSEELLAAKTELEFVESKIDKLRQISEVFMEYKKVPPAMWGERILPST